MKLLPLFKEESKEKSKEPAKELPKALPKEPDKELPKEPDKELELSMVYDVLKQVLADMGSVLLACSGGADSMLLLDVAHEVLGNNLAVATIRAPYMFEHECKEVEVQARRKGLRLYTPLLPFGDGPEDLWHNSEDRCYICKSYLFAQLDELRQSLGLTWLMDGTQKDDNPAERPGFRALRELGVRSPLLESGLGKVGIRQLARDRGLAAWDKPSNSCLLTRFSYNTDLTEEVLWRVGQAETFLRAFGLTQFRARFHDDMLCIETEPDDFKKIVAEADAIVSSLKDLGFVRISLNLEGYSSK